MEKWQMMAVGFVVLIMGVLIYGVLTKNQPETPDIPTSDTAEPQPMSRNARIWTGLIILGIIAAVVWWRWDKKRRTGDYFTKKAMKPDDFDDIIKQRMIHKDGMRGYYDDSGVLQFAPDTVRMKDHRYWTPSGSTHVHMAKEFEILDPDIDHVSGLKTIMVNLNQEPDLIKSGMYASHNHIGIWDWVRTKSYFRKMPLITQQSENLQLAQYLAENELDASEFKQMIQPRPLPQSTEEEGDETQPEQQSTDQVKKK